METLQDSWSNFVVGGKVRGSATFLDISKPAIRVGKQIV